MAWLSKDLQDDKDVVSLGLRGVTCSQGRLLSLMATSSAAAVLNLCCGMVDSDLAVKQTWRALQFTVRLLGSILQRAVTSLAGCFRYRANCLGAKSIRLRGDGAFMLKVAAQSVATHSQQVKKPIPRCHASLRGRPTVRD